MKISLLQSVGLIAQAVGACLRRQNYLFARKQELVGVLMVSGACWDAQGDCRLWQHMCTA